MMENVPKGFRFHPTDQELIEYYLNLKNKGVEGAADVLKLVHEYDLYGDTEPWKIFKDHQGDDLCDQDLYFFTKQKLIQERKQVDQTIGTGTWRRKQRSTITITRNETDTKIGVKCVFRYENESSVQPLPRACWFLEEYSTEDTKSSGYVICRLRKKIENGDRSRGNTNFPAMSVPTSIDYARPIPVGFRFRPTDEELIRYLLSNEIREKGGRGLVMSKDVVADPDLELQLSLKTITAGETIEPAEDKRKSNGLSNVETEAEVPVLLEEQMRKKEKGKEKVVEEGMMQEKDEGERSLLPTEKDNPFLHEFDLYGKMEPWDIWRKFGGDELCYQDLFFFTQWKKAHPNSKRVARKVGSPGGKWYGSQARKRIKDRSGKLIGHKQRFQYKRTGNSPNMEWYLDEYSLPEARVGDYVICRLRKIDKLASDASSPDEDSSNKKMKIDPGTSTLATTEGSNQGQATAEESKQEEDSSEAKPKRDTELAEVDEAGKAGNHTMRLFGYDIDLRP